jgi:hypothetical protein
MMVNKINQAYLSQLSINPKFALKTYEALVSEGIQACEDESTFVESVKLVTQVLLRFDDYIHSNNLLQIAKSDYIEIENLPWYQYAQLQILTKRVPKYILIHPDFFLKKLQYLLKVDSLTSQMDAFLMVTLDSIIDYLPYFDSSFRIVVRTFTETLIKKGDMFSSLVQSKLQELKAKALPKMIGGTPVVEVETVPTLDLTNLKINDSKAVVLIVGDLAMKKHDVQGIAKEFGISHGQLEFVEFNESKQHSFRQLRYASKYAGIILGPVPHMVSDLDGHTSLVELLKEPGYPHTFVAVQGGELKLSKQLLKKGFTDVVAHYNSRGVN